MDQLAVITISLIIGYLLDRILADPVKFPHPIKWFGVVIVWGDAKFNRGRFRALAGATFSIVIITVTYTILFLLEKWLVRQPMVFRMGIHVLLVFWGLANQSLIRESKKVFHKLEDGLIAGRQQLSSIVGRDTNNLNEQQVKTAALETMSENLSDGVIAPLFYYALFGIPGIMAYKLINTLDSMIGYKNERHDAFGKFAARLDDVVNYIPARITVLLMSLSSLNVNGLVYAIQYGHLHSSPNAGYPEAALAGILNCRFGGPNYYNGVLISKPYIGKTDKQITHDDLRKATYINQGSTILWIIVIMLAHLLWREVW